MSRISEYFIELQTLNIKSNSILSLSNYSQHESNYENKLKELQQFALSEIRTIRIEDTSEQLFQFKEIQKRFSDFIKLYSELTQIKKIQVSEIKRHLNNYFIIPEKITAVKFENDFFLDLHDALTLKSGSLDAFLFQIEKQKSSIIIDFKETYNKEVTPKRKSELRKTLKTINGIDNKINFLEKERLNYLQEISPEVFEVSGKTSLPNIEKGSPLFWDRYLIIEIEKLNHEKNSTHTSENIKSELKENNFLESTIDEWLEPFNNNMSNSDYKILVSAIKQHIETGSFPELKKEIQINRRPAQKKFGWAINRIYHAKNMGVEKALLVFARKNISLFKNAKFNEKNFLNCNLYKYFTTKA